jgi:retinol dehydrogenase-14
MPKTILITGATSGIGRAAATELAAAGERVVLVGRNPDKLHTTLASIRERTGNDHLDSLVGDFASQRSVRALAEGFRDRHHRLDVLVNNAGTVSAKRTVTEDGIEATFAVNHLGPFLLTELLLDLIVASAPARIVNVSSVGHYGGTMNFDDLGFERGYHIMRAYARSKLANVLFTRRLAKRLAGTGVTVNAVHPGAVATDIWGGAPWFAKPVVNLWKRLTMISPEHGARPIVYLATSPEVEGTSGQYFNRMKPAAPSRLAQDDALAERLWAESSRLVGLPA